MKRKLPPEEIERSGGILDDQSPEDEEEGLPEKETNKQQDNGAGSSWDMKEAGDSASWLRKDLRVVLVHPQIPQNTGTVARTCAAAGVPLHLVEPLGFELSDTKLKRAGLNYWPYVCVKVHKSWEQFFEFFKQEPEPRRLIAFSKFATKKHATPGTFKKGDWLLFGAETTGLPDVAHEAAKQHGEILRIPMIERYVRSLNLAVSQGIGLYEAMRQIDEGESPDAKDENVPQQHAIEKN
eukprot:TRINITY_DN9045_c0_g1_i1.p1 TRINITY_DN9045_c0_g1~~TRINITY_DN9045_c0_g1_i1.p1  ORF type:complete len:238 (-),score=32.40 TRINITY_DN9045_c0_g1_i1:258-971(-)